MGVLIPKDYNWTGIQQDNHTGLMSVRFYIHKDKTKFIIVFLENGEETSVGGPFPSSATEILYYGMKDFESFVRTGRP